MEGADRDTTSNSSALYAEGGRGAGGKVRKTPARKISTTTAPYARPAPKPLAQRRDNSGGWLSKLVNPAYRLIAGGATKLLPSYFSNSESDVANDDVSSFPTSDRVIGATEATPNTYTNGKDDVELGISRFTEEAGPSNIVRRLKDTSENNDIERSNMRNPSDDSELAKIEQLVKGKRFSRDEINRLTEILNSRVVDVSDTQRDKRHPCSTSWGQAKGALLDHSNPKVSIEMNRDELNRAILETPAPCVQPNLKDEVGASPIEIARAYMGSQASETGLGSFSTIAKDEKGREKSGIYSSKPFFPTPSTKSSPCWPGAVVRDHCGYLTPQNERASYGLQNFPRTPYSRTLHSKSKTKLTELKADSRRLNNSLMPFQQSRTPNSGLVKSRNGVDGGYGSVGPIRRIRNKFASESSFGGSTSLYSARNSPFQVENSSGGGGFLTVSEKNPDPSGIGGTANYQSAGLIAQTSKEVPVPPAPSSQTVKRILEELDRHQPTPNEKAAELKLATAWKRSSEDTTIRQKEGTSSADLGVSDSPFKGRTEQKLSVEGNDSSENLKGLPTEQSALSKIFSTVAGDRRELDDASVGGSFGFKKTHDSQMKSTHENTILGNKSGEEGTSQIWPLSNRANGLDPTKLPPVAFRSDSLKKRSSQQNLKPISFKRPDPQRVASSDNGLGFTFPFSASAGQASEPPTPSVMPSLMVSAPPQQEGPSIPVYSFGAKKSTSGLVFTFPSTSSSYIESDASDLKFNFGSDKKSRISFGAVGNGAIS